MIKTPEFWNHKGITSTALLPLAALWSLATHLRDHLAKQTSVALPVICIGNLSAGGTGKTPLVSLLYDRLVDAGMNPVILSRGYGGSQKGPLWVDGTIHTAADCGDEPLMLAEGRDVIIGRDRIVAAQTIINRGIHNIILMDDGLQNPYLNKDMAVGVFDGTAGIGNGRLLPAGPMRVTFDAGLASLDFAFINGEDEHELAKAIDGRVPIMTGTVVADQTIITDLGDAPLLAFAGIGRPQRFFRTIEKVGGTIVQSLAFADHHLYTQSDLSRLQEDSIRLGANLITTQKDWIRLPSEWRERISFLPITMQTDAIDELLGHIMAIADQKASHGINV
ncbi:MAG: tetraacyldisaccharide 4'-kinase [Candidatus Puniceispirillum sp.]|jgi:tetraacyldisaccharide 4'-kinase|uniref:tetraacyldisaccharide 4'-kinase n=1 Tax=Candidatus Puniceispirillum sp. TaxID=2026719 RepID=UPI001EB54388|nr:tetraacyldisaccharide 4'-kinase [Candidatus Puniceispirillum sp.]MBT6415095.1 tetraacyldisaccharide 4'-kinase [Candidatus Puniceispirillum sp.]MBT6566832.1 tetraacyldisaccharide 4'-kinase [Candidatus Puniceispirillum sp.]